MMASSSKDVDPMDHDDTLSETIDALITAMMPLLSSPSLDTIPIVLSAVRKVNASHEEIVSTLAIFGKLIQPAQDTTDHSNRTNRPNTPTTPTTPSHTATATTTNAPNINNNLNNSSNSSNSHQILFRAFVQQLENAGLVKRAHLYQVFEPEERFQYVDRSLNHINESKRQRTRLWFTQARYTLYCEQSEGYAKVITLIFSTVESTTPPNSQKIIDELVVLIGQFSLDTNRVIEIVLSAASEVVGDLIARSHDLPFDHRLPQTFVAILGQFPRHHILDVVSATFHVYHANQVTKTDAKECSESHPSSNPNASTPAPASAFLSRAFTKFGVKHAQSSPQSPIAPAPQQSQSVGSVLPPTAVPNHQLVTPINSQAVTDPAFPTPASGMKADFASATPAQEAASEHLSPSNPAAPVKSPSRYDNEWVQKLLANNFPPLKPDPSYFKFDCDDPAVERRAFNCFLGLVVVLLREEYFAVSEIWHHVHPQDNEMLFAACEKFESELAELSTYICSSTSELPKRIADDSSKIPQKNSNSSDRDLWHQYKFIAQGPFPNAFHQRFELINMLISMCRWRDAKAAILHLCFKGEHVDIAAEPNITKTLSAIVEILISPALRTVQGSSHAENKNITDAIEKLGGVANGYVALVRSVDEFLSEEPNSPGADVRDMLYILGPYARGSVRLLFSLCRLLKGRREPAAFDIMRDVVLPASSLIQSNCGLSEAIWGVLRDWPHHLRWGAYGHIQNEVFGSCPIYQLYAKRASYEMRYVLKRLTSETRTRHMHTVAKITHGQALPAFSAALDRIQGYPADSVTITPIVDVCVNCTDLSLDMLMFLAIDRMADSRRSRLKKDGINVAQWYATLSLFLGVSMRKLPLMSAHIEGVTNFLCKRLAVEPEPLLITALSDMIKCVADVEVDVNLTTKQIKACGGGTVLQELASGPWSRLQPDPNMIGHTFDQRLDQEKNEAIFGLQCALAKSGVHTDLAVSIAQLTRSAIFDDDLKAMPLKLCANIIDRARASLMQLSQFLRLVPKNIPRPEDVQKALWRPLKSLGLAKLLTEMNTPTSSAVILMSPTLDFLVTSTQLDPQATSEGVNAGRTKAKSVEKELPLSHPSQDNPNKGEEMTSTNDKDTSANTNNSNEASPHSSPPLRAEIGFDEVISNRTKGLLSPALVYAFWTLKLADIAIPTDLYQEERKRMLSVKSLWEKELDRFRRHTSGELEGARRCETEYRLIRDFTTNLEEEREVITKRHEAVLEKLRKIRDDLHRPSASGSDSERHQSARLFLQECVIPRCRVSVPDALFCAKFIFLMLQMDIPVVSISHFFETFLNLIPTLLRSCSENEALGITRLTNELLSVLEKWRSNKTGFEREMSALKHSGLQYVNESGKCEQFRHERLCEWLFEIHQRLTTGMCEVVSSQEYLYSRNSLSVLVGVGEFFPKVTEHARRIEDAVSRLVDSDMEDIRLTANGVLARLKAGFAMRIPEHIFRLKPHSVHGASSSSVLPPANAAAPSANKIGSKPKIGGDGATKKRNNTESAPVKKTSSFVLAVGEQAKKGREKMASDSRISAKPEADLEPLSSAGDGQPGEKKVGENEDVSKSSPRKTKTEPLPVLAKRKSPEAEKREQGNDIMEKERSNEVTEPTPKRARADLSTAKDGPRESRPDSQRETIVEGAGDAAQPGVPIPTEDQGERTLKDEGYRADGARAEARREARRGAPGRKMGGDDTVGEQRRGNTVRRSPGARASPADKSPMDRHGARVSPGNARPPVGPGNAQKSPRDTGSGNEKERGERGERGMKRAYSKLGDDGARRDGRKNSNGRDGSGGAGAGTVPVGDAGVGGGRRNDADGGGTHGLGSHGSSGSLHGTEGSGGPVNKRRRDGGPRGTYGEGRKSGRVDYERQNDGRYGNAAVSPRWIRSDGGSSGGGGGLKFVAVQGQGQGASPGHGANTGGASGYGPGSAPSARSNAPPNTERGRNGEERRRGVPRKREDVLDSRAVAPHGMIPPGAPVGATVAAQAHPPRNMMGPRSSPPGMTSGSGAKADGDSIAVFPGRDPADEWRGRTSDGEFIAVFPGRDRDERDRDGRDRDREQERDSVERDRAWERNRERFVPRDRREDWEDREGRERDRDRERDHMRDRERDRDRDRDRDHRRMMPMGRRRRGNGGGGSGGRGSAVRGGR